jgi:hypothetical protein
MQLLRLSPTNECIILALYTVNHLYNDGHTSRSLFGSIFAYIPWGIQFEWASYFVHLPLIKVWTER